MAKEKEPQKVEEIKESRKFGKVISGFTNLLIIACLVFLGYYMYKNPEIIKNYVSQQKENKEAIVFEAPTPEYVEVLLGKIADLNSEVAQVSNMIVNQNSRFVESGELVELARKYEAMEKTSLAVIDSKADNKTVLEMVFRMDRLEKKVEDVAKISDKGALIMSATMLVKERADRGDKFGYEAEVLSNLAQGEERIKSAVDTIISLSYETIPSNQEILKEFDKLYNKATYKAPVVEEGTWLERLRAKFHENIQIRKTSEQAVEVVNEEKIALDAIKADVESFRFAKALEEMETNKNMDADNWKKLVKNRLEFDRAVSKISAYSLALMKVNTLK